MEDISIHNTIGVRELAAKLGVSEPTIYFWISKKGFSHTKIGTRIRFTPEQAARAVTIHLAVRR